jgi:AcrR family transcriptional regulator
MPVKTHRSPTAARRSRNPQGQGGRLRLELIAAADRILAQTGDVEGLSLRGVAREVGIATPSIYLHFPDKSALIHAVLEARFAELGAAVRAAIDGSREPSEQLRAGCMAYCRFATEQPNAYRVLFGRAPTVPASDSHPNEPRPHNEGPSPSEGGSGSGQHQPAIGVGAPTFNLLVQSVAACMRAEPAPSGDPMRVAINLWTALHGIVSLRGSVPVFPWPPLEQQVDDAIGGLLRPHHNPSAFEGAAGPDRYTSVEA